MPFAITLSLSVGTAKFRFSIWPEVSGRSKEMEFLKYKIDNQLWITEARRWYTKSSKPKNYAKAVKSAKPAPNSTYITKKKKNMELYFQCIQECIQQVLQQRINLFLQAIEGLITTLTVACACKTQKISSSKERPVTSTSKGMQKKLKVVHWEYECLPCPRTQQAEQKCVCFVTESYGWARHRRYGLSLLSLFLYVFLINFVVSPHVIVF